MAARAYRRNSGFSLTEVLIAAGILTIGFMLLLTLFPLGLKLTANNTEKTISMLSQQEVFFNASRLMQADPNKAGEVDGYRYDDFRELFWDDEDGDGIIDFREADYTADNGDYELEYDPYLFLYPTAGGVNDEGKKYNFAMLIGQRDGDFAELIVFTCRRVGANSRFPAAVTEDLQDENNLSERPNLLSLETDDSYSYDDVPGSWIKISDSQASDLGENGLSPFIGSGTRIIVNRRYLQYQYGTTVTGLEFDEETGDYFVVVDRNYSKATRRSLDRIWFVPPAVGSSRSAAVDVERRFIRIK